MIRITPYISILFIFISGCTTTQQISFRSQLTGNGVLIAQTKDTTQYQFDSYQLVDSILIGDGIRFKHGEKSVVTLFHLPLNEVHYLEMNTPKGAQWIIAIMAGGFLIQAVTNLDGGTGISVNEQTGTYYPPSGKSCPTLYAWNGSKYILEGEAISVALGRALEMTTRTVLPHLESEKGAVRVRITNERPETHYLNHIGLVAVETDSIARVIPAIDNSLWAVHNSQSPVAAFDKMGRDVRTDLSAADAKFWESDLEIVESQARFGDTLQLSFLRPRNTDTASLIVEAINTEISNAVFSMLYSTLGDQTLSFIRASEYDPEMIALLREWQATASLSVSVWNGSRWVDAGAILPEANAVLFARLVRVQIPDGVGDTVRVRLTSLADVWKIDVVTIDYADAKPLDALPVATKSVRSPYADGQELLAQNDERYIMLLPPQEVEMEFKALTRREGKKITYAVDVSGFLYEWVPSSAKQESSSFTSFVPAQQRVSFVKHLLSNKTLLLPIVYREWMREKSFSNTIYR